MTKELFFANGESKRGKGEEFAFSIKDFKGEEMGSRTVSELYEESKVKILRLYMYTKKNEGGSDHQSNNESVSHTCIT